MEDQVQYNEDAAEDDNLLIPMFMELYVGMQAQGTPIPDALKGVLLQMFAAGAAAATHLMANGIENDDGSLTGVSLININEAANELLDGFDEEEDSDEDFEPENEGPTAGSVGYTVFNGTKLYEDDDLQ